MIDLDPAFDQQLLDIAAQTPTPAATMRENESERSQLKPALIMRSGNATEPERDQRAGADEELIPVTVNEIRHLFAELITNTARTIGYWLHWSAWRRRHQQRARTSHYRRRGAEIDRHPSHNGPGLPYQEP